MISVKVIVDFMNVMRPPPAFGDFLSSRTVVKFGMVGVLDLSVSLDSCMVMISALVLTARSVSSCILDLMPLALNWMMVSCGFWLEGGFVVWCVVGWLVFGVRWVIGGFGVGFVVGGLAGVGGVVDVVEE